MSATTSNLHDQFHAMLQNMRQAPLQSPPPIAQPQLPTPQAIVLAGGNAKHADTVALSGGGQKDNISKFFKKHWGKILALCIIVVVVTVFVARYFITKRKKNKQLKEASEDQENIQWEQFFNVPQGQQPQLPQQAQQLHQPRPFQQAPPLSEAQPHHRPTQQQQPQGQQQQQPQAQPRPSQRVPPQIQQITAQLNGNNGPVIQSQAPTASPTASPTAAPAPVDPRIEAIGLRIPKKESKEKENDLPKPDTDVTGKSVAPVAPKGVEIDSIVTA